MLFMVDLVSVNIINLFNSFAAKGHCQKDNGKGDQTGDGYFGAQVSKSGEDDNGDQPNIDGGVETPDKSDAQQFFH